MRARNLLHRCTYVLVLDPRGQIYVHRRTDTKDIYPGMYDMTAGGVCASGGSYDDGAARRRDHRDTESRLHGSRSVPSPRSFRLR